jgi:hypothetical protein
MFKRIGVVLAAAMLGAVAFAVPASSQPEPRFTLTINPTQGPVGTNIHAQLPAEATTQGGPCLSKGDIQAGLQQLIAGIIANGQPPPSALQKVLLSVISGGIAQLDLNDPNTFRFFFALAFADPATQAPAIDETTGQPSATSFWDPATGQGDITAPAAARPKTYFVAGVCLKLKSLDQIDVAAVIAALQAGIDQGSTAFQTCLQQVGGGNPSCLQNFQALVGEIATPVITELVDQNSDIAWVAPFCLLGDNGQDCSVPAEGAAEPVAAEPSFTG